MATTRVYILANELGVKSSAIIKKCQDEGLDVKNHMAVLSAGLAATIREWFSEGDNVTTVETAERVDLERVRVRPRHKKTDAGGEDEATGEGHEAEAVEEGAEAPASPVETPEDVPYVQVETPPAPAAEEVVPQPVGEQVAPPAATPEESKPAEPVVVVPPPKPTIVPAGPMMGKPTPAKLQGPRVVRIEATRAGSAFQTASQASI